MSSVTAMTIQPKDESTRDYVVIQVDSFTRTRLGGNPCAVIFCINDMDDATMHAVAREMNLPVTSFVLAPRKSNFRARYFTLEAETPFAGHPTLATIHALYHAGQIECFNGQATVTLELGGGIVTVDILEEEDGATLITMDQKAPTFLQTLDAKSVVEAVWPGCCKRARNSSPGRSPARTAAAPCRTPAAVRKALPDCSRSTDRPDAVAD